MPGFFVGMTTHILPPGINKIKAPWAACRATSKNERADGRSRPSATGQNCKRTTNSPRREPLVPELTLIYPKPEVGTPSAFMTWVDKALLALGAL